MVKKTKALKGRLVPLNEAIPGRRVARANGVWADGVCIPISQYDEMLVLLRESHAITELLNFGFPEDTDPVMFREAVQLSVSSLRKTLRQCIVHARTAI